MNCTSFQPRIFNLLRFFPKVFEESCSECNPNYLFVYFLGLVVFARKSSLEKKNRQPASPTSRLHQECDQIWEFITKIQGFEKHFCYFLSFVDISKLPNFIYVCELWDQHGSTFINLLILILISSKLRFLEKLLGILPSNCLVTLLIRPAARAELELAA